LNAGPHSALQKPLTSLDLAHLRFHSIELPLENASRPVANRRFGFLLDNASEDFADRFCCKARRYQPADVVDGGDRVATNATYIPVIAVNLPI
jgi:hypothetical protein